MGVTAAGKEWLRKWELWVESDVGQETITKNLNGLAKLMGVPESDRERFCFETWFWIGYATIGPALSLQKGYAKDVILQDAELKIRAAHKAVERLCSAKKKYQDFNFGTDIEPKGLEECERVLSNLVAAFSVMHSMLIFAAALGCFFGIVSFLLMGSGLFSSGPAFRPADRLRSRYKRPLD